ncbi:cell division initiation protein [Streptomyces triculaminicus]|uniref:Cell division initiation protein n=2 Tax=Streptomyces TaxID=1883 RepID=A0A939FP65_9ACTN|nr:MULTISPECIES: cell division initiation protein [Streptomyces]MBO0655253.1 cell division initiation protein [Streptomyces triculaminicus]QSY52329.1 cell division initiation protein [Streptomyces griseocarneus]
MDVQKKLDEIVTTVAAARALPMSASCVLNRAELLARLEELRAALPGSLAQAEEVIGGRERMVADARAEAERILGAARAQRGSLISDTEVAREAREEAGRILEAARREAAAIRAGADDYVDGKLANFEVVLTKTIASVDRGREKLLGLTPADPASGRHADHADDAPERAADPARRRRDADAYVDAKLGAVSAVLASTLEAAGRGREKLLAGRPVDELAAHMAAQERLPGGRPADDADFLAGLAAPQEPAGPPQEDRAAGWGDHAAPAGEYDGQDGQDPYGAPQPYPPQLDPYAVPGGYPQQPDPYAWPAQDPAQHRRYPERPQAAALDETSLFDTGVIDLDRLRQYDQGR